MSIESSSVDELYANHVEVLRAGLEALIRNRKSSVGQLERLRARARDVEQTSAEDLLLQVQQSDQRLIDQGEKILEQLRIANGAQPADRLIDETSAESFPASDPPSYSGST